MVSQQLPPQLPRRPGQPAPVPRAAPEPEGCRSSRQMPGTVFMTKASPIGLGCLHRRDLKWPPPPERAPVGRAPAARHRGDRRGPSARRGAPEFKINQSPAVVISEEHYQRLQQQTSPAASRPWSGWCSNHRSLGGATRPRSMPTWRRNAPGDGVARRQCPVLPVGSTTAMAWVGKAASATSGCGGSTRREACRTCP